MDGVAFADIVAVAVPPAARSPSAGANCSQGPASGPQPSFSSKAASRLRHPLVGPSSSRTPPSLNADGTQDDVALAVEGDKIAAIGPTAEILKKYPNADVYDGRGKALLPGLVNCHMHMSAVLSRGFNEDFGFPNSVRLAVSPGSLLQAKRPS